MAEVGRPLRFSGSWYPQDLTTLSEMIEGAIKTTPKKVVNPRMAILPHSGLFFSIRSMAHLISSVDKPLTHVILFSPSHYVPLQSNSVYQSTFDWYETPYQNILNFPLSLSYQVEHHQRAFAAEHGVEMVLPILGYMQKRAHHPIKLSMFLVSHFSDEDTTKIFIDALLESLAQEGISSDEVLFIASSDFTHWGKNYHHTPFPHRTKEELLHQIRETDLTVISDLIGGKHSKQTIYPCNACGYFAMSIISQLAQHLKLHGNVIDYYHSSDISHDYENIVSYATIFFKESSYEYK